MKIEDQVCSLELAKRLKELGVKQESLFVWRGVQEWRFGPHKYNLAYAPHIVDDTNFSAKMKKNALPVLDTVSAFTVAELGEMLPQGAKSWETNLGWSCSYWKSVLDGHIGRIVNADTEADARANMLIYLIENKLITI